MYHPRHDGVFTAGGLGEASLPAWLRITVLVGSSLRELRLGERGVCWSMYHPRHDGVFTAGGLGEASPGVWLFLDW